MRVKVRFSASSSHPRHARLRLSKCVSLSGTQLTLRKYLMFLLWKSPGGSNRYRSSSHRSRRKPGTQRRHQTLFITPTLDSSVRLRHAEGVRLPSSSLCEVHTTSRQIFLSISTSASKKESSSSSVMSPVQTSLRFSISAQRPCYTPLWLIKKPNKRKCVCLLCLSSLSARRSWAFLNTRKWVAKSSTRRVVK